MIVFHERLPPPKDGDAAFAGFSLLVFAVIALTAYASTYVVGWLAKAVCQ